MIKHFFLGKDCKIDRELSDKSEIENFLREKNIEFCAVNFVSQIHSNEVVVIDGEDKILPNQNLPKADAVVTNLKNLAIAVVTADCAPIIFKDEESEIAAVVHAGWRGAKSGVIENALKEMLEIGAEIKNIKAFLGPMIKQKSYQVSKDFYDDFLQDDKRYEKYFIDDEEKAKFLFDLPSFVKDKTLSCGVEFIDDVEIDTYLSEDFYSYRKSCHEGKNKFGRNVSLAVIA